MVVHIGYGTKRGRILRRILHKTVTVSHLFTTCLYFLSITYGVAVIIYLATMKMRIDNGIVEGLIIFLHFLLIVTLCFPPGCPIYFNLVYSFCLMRLKWNNILGTDP
jgi:magnesium-transporting ATPase (P-type)